MRSATISSAELFGYLPDLRHLFFAVLLVIGSLALSAPRFRSGTCASIDRLDVDDQVGFDKAALHSHQEIAASGENGGSAVGRHSGRPANRICPIQRSRAPGTV